MLLNELTGIKNQSDKSLNDLIIDFIAKNYKKIGIGSFAAVFDNPKKPNEVIKFWASDPAYEEYINFALKHPSKHFLKVYKTGELTLNLNDQKIKLKYAKIEKLNRTEMFDDFSSGIELSEVLYFIESIDLEILKLPHILELASKEFNKNGKLPDDVSEFIVNVYEHKMSRAYQSVAIVLNAFIAFERMYFEVAKPPLKEKVRVEKPVEVISGAEARRRAENKAKRDADKAKKAIEA